MDVYSITLDCHLSERVVRWLGCERIDDLPCGQVVLVTRPLDQAGLHGLLVRVRDLNIAIVSLWRHDRGEHHE